MNVTDNQVIEQIRAGDTRKYALLVDRHKGKAFTLALRLTGDRQESEELVQDAFVRAYRGLESFRGDAKFSTWLYRIVYNLCMTKISRRRPQNETVDLREEELDNIYVDEDGIGVDEKLENEERKLIVRDEVNELPEKFKTVVTLFYLQEMSYEEMTEVLNLPIGTVKTNLFRGRNLLRERILSRFKAEIA